MQNTPSFLDFRAAYTKNQQDNQYDDEEFYGQYDDYGEEELQWSGSMKQRKSSALKQQNLNQKNDTKVNQKLKEHNSQLLAKLLAKNSLNSQATKNPTQQPESQKRGQSQTIRLNLSDKLSRILSNNPHEILKKSLHGIRDQPVQITRNPKYLRNHELMQLKNQFKDGTQGKQIVRGNQEYFNLINNNNMIPNSAQEKVNNLFKSLGVPQKDANRILQDKESYNDKGNNKSKGSSEEVQDQRNGIEYFHKQACLLYVANLMLKDQVIHMQQYEKDKAKELYEDNAKLKKIAEIMEIQEKKSILEYQSELKSLNKQDRNEDRSIKMEEDSDEDDEDDNNKQIYYSDSQNESESEVKGQLLICPVQSCQKAYYNKISLKSHTRRKHPRQKRQPYQLEEIFHEKKEENEEEEEKVYFDTIKKESPKPQIVIKLRKNQLG